MTTAGHTRGQDKRDKKEKGPRTTPAPSPRGARGGASTLAKLLPKICIQKYVIFACNCYGRASRPAANACIIATHCIARIAGKRVHTHVYTRPVLRSLSSSHSRDFPNMRRCTTNKTNKQTQDESFVDQCNNSKYKRTHNGTTPL